MKNITNTRSGNDVKVSFNYKTYKHFRDHKIRGTGFIGCKGFCREVAMYIACHEAAGIHFDTDCQMICYDDCVVLTLRKVQGVWRIVDVEVKGSVTVFRPVFVWKLIKRGINIFAAKFLEGWCLLRDAAPAMP